MRPELWAVVTAVCWAGGSFFEKKGVRLGGFAPIMGTALRTFTSAALLAVLSRPMWHQVRDAGAKPVLMIMLAGGVVAGTMGIASFYNALRDGELSVVLPIAFCLTPVLGVILGSVLLGERLSVAQYCGIALTTVGAVLAVAFE